MASFAFTLERENGTPADLRFPTSQYANVVLRRGAKIMYSWSYHRGFLQVNTARRLGPRATYVCSLAPDLLDLEPGRYELIAYLASTVPIRTRRSFVAYRSDGRRVPGEPHE